tara:strand:- start:1013 stop:1345 length:333 start_codon:yes stop_codon:yes gene_type:complete
MNRSKKEEFDMFQDEVKKLKLINPQKTIGEKSVNLKTYGISETNKQRAEIEYYTNQNRKKISKCFCQKSNEKKPYFRFVEALYDAQIFKQSIYVCDIKSKFRIYHLTSKN